MTQPGPEMTRSWDFDSSLIPCFFAVAGTPPASDSRTIRTICSSVNLDFFMAPRFRGGHPLRFQMDRKSPGRSGARFLGETSAAREWPENKSTEKLAALARTFLSCSQRSRRVCPDKFRGKRSWGYAYLSYRKSRFPCCAAR